MDYASIGISVLSIIISIFTFWKTLFDERQKYKVDIINIFSPEHLVSPAAGIVYLEIVVTNDSSLPLVLITSKMKINKTGIRNLNMSANALLIDSLISMHKGMSGSTTNKSNALPLTIQSRDAVHCILAYPAPGILGLESDNTKIEISIVTNRKDDISISNSELKHKMTTLENFLKERVRIA